MKITSTAIIYENPLPQLKSIQSYFPFLFETKEGKIGAVTVLGEAFESVNGRSFISFSEDGGKSFGAPRAMFSHGEREGQITDYAKATVLPDGRIVALGYAYLRDDPSLPIGNPENGGVLDDFVFWSVSDDEGESFSEMRKIDCAWGPHVEASAPLTVLKDGSWISPITGFPDWNGKMHGRLCGRALRSYDGGESWSDDVVCMDFGDSPITCYEQRMCRLESGVIVNIGWNENNETGERLMNHYTYSTDGGKSFSSPESTGVLGQASSVCAIGGEQLLALHAVRRDTDRPGIYGYVIDFSERRWRVVDEALLWEPPAPIVKDTRMAEIFSFLKFGQPGAILLSDGDAMMSHWFFENGEYKTVASRISLKEYSKGNA